MKHEEIRLASYASDYFIHEHIIPFFELIYEPDDKGKNKSIYSFLEKTDCKKYFLGIPHKKTALVKKDRMYASNVNENVETYFNASLKLFEVDNAIPVFYVYDENDAHYVYHFLTKAKKENKSIGLVITTSSARNIPFSSLTENDYVFVDINNDKLSSKKVTLNRALTDCKSKIILMRENRRVELTNSVISNGMPAPFECDLSNEIKDSIEELTFNIFGFADFCGYKNTIATSGGGGHRDKTFPAWPMYSRKDQLPQFIGIKSSISLEEDQKRSFNDLMMKSIEQMKVEKNIEKTTSIEMLNQCTVTVFAFWNVLTQWHYLSQMVIYDDWKNIN